MKTLCPLSFGRLAWLLALAIPLLPWLPSRQALAQGATAAITPAWTAPYYSDLTDYQPVWFGRDGSALLGQQGRTNWLWVGVDGQRAMLTDPYFADPMVSWSIVQMTSRVLLAEVRGGGMMSTNADWHLYRRGTDGTVTLSMLSVAGVAFPPGSAAGAFMAGRSVTRSVSRVPPDGWFASEVDTGTPPMGMEPNRLLTLYKLDLAALEGGTGRPVLALERGEPLRLRIESESGGPMLIQASDDLKNWLPWAALIEPGASVVLPVVDATRPRRFFMVEQMDGATGLRNPWE